MSLEPRRIVTPEEFLDRHDERRKLAALVKARDNVLVYGPRRLGKTSLIRRLEADLGDRAFLFVDCNFATTEAGLSEQLLRSLGASGLGRMPRFADWVRESVKGLEVAVEIGDGVNVVLRRGFARLRPLEDALEVVTRVARAAKRHIVLVLDEFQHVMEATPEAIGKLRGHAQSQRDVSYLLSGSQKSVLLGLTQHKNPFWRQLTEFPLGPIDVEQAMDDWGKRVGSKISAPARRFLAEVSKGNTQRLVEIVEEARAQGRSYAPAALTTALGTVLARHNASFERTLSRCTVYQKQVLIALAVARPDKPMGTRFVTEHALRGPAHVRKAILAMTKEEILEDGAFVDPLFEHWLRVNNPPG